SNAIPPRLWSDPSLSPPSAPQPLAQMIANYLLTRSSPAINAGVTLSGFNTDITGDIRTAGAWDIGADEFGGSATTVNVGASATTVDFDGDGRSDIALYRDGVWWILRSSNGGGIGVTFGGAPQDIPVPGDYDGDGKTDQAVYRDGVWYILRSSD